jgi:hypothetical protein
VGSSNFCFLSQNSKPDDHGDDRPRMRGLSYNYRSPLKMKAAPAPIVLTAGVGRNIKAAKKNNKGKGKQQQAPDNNHAADEEAGTSVLSVTNTQDGSLQAQNNIATTAALHTNGEGNNKGIVPVDSGEEIDRMREQMIKRASVILDDLYSAPPVIDTEVEVTKHHKSSEFFWLAFCFFGIMGSFVCYGLLLEYATSGGKHLHELSFLFVTSLLYTLTALVGRYIRAEEQSTIPPAQFFVLGLTSMGSTFCSVRALRYVIYPIQVLAKSCKPVPVMLMGALMGKKYPAKKYLKVALIVGGVGLFMGGG